MSIYCCPLPLGLVSANGLQWVHDRRFVLRHLRDLGMGKTYIENAIQDEAKALVEDLKSLNEKPSTYPDSLRTAVLNIIWQLVSGKRYDLKSKEVERIYAITEKFRQASFAMFFEGFFPIFKILPQSIRYYMFKVNIVDEFRQEMKRIIKVRLMKAI